MYESLFGLTGLPFQLSPDASRTINHLVVTEYMNEFAAGSRTGTHTGASPW